MQNLDTGISRHLECVHLWKIKFVEIAYFFPFSRRWLHPTCSLAFSGNENYVLRRAVLVLVPNYN
jgi:hypothetical protein